MYIYKLTNEINGKIYVGKHNGSKKNYMGSGVILRKAVEKYGIENFTKEILEECKDHSELNEKEKFWIKKLNAIDKKIGYNLTEGGDGFAAGALNPMHRKEVKEFFRELFKGAKNPSCRPEVRKKISDTLRGKKLSEEHRAAITKGLTGRKVPVGEESKLSKIFTVQFPDGHTEEIKGLRKFCRDHNLNAKLLRKTLKGLTKHHKHYVLIQS